jgi:hypothetical protein
MRIPGERKLYEPKGDSEPERNNPKKRNCVISVDKTLEKERKTQLTSPIATADLNRCHFEVDAPSHLNFIVAGPDSPDPMALYEACLENRLRPR